MKTIDVVAAIIRDGEGRIFATERGYGEWKDWWEFPGGKIETAIRPELGRPETPEEALRREIREELAADIEVGEQLCTVEYDYPQFHLSMRCFLCRLLSSPTLLELEDARWLRPEDLDSVKWLPADVEVVKNIGI